MKAPRCRRFLGTARQSLLPTLVDSLPGSLMHTQLTDLPLETLKERLVANDDILSA